MGSVKDLEVIKPASGDETGVGRFSFSDRYSVFDWGEMPDLIKNKGEALCMMTAFFFELLEERGIKTHYRGLVAGGRVVKLSEIDTPSSIMEIALVNVEKPRGYDGNYDYSIYKTLKGNFLIPLEVIYRFSLPEGSSVFKRLNSGSLSYQDLGLNEMPKPGTKLSEPFIDFSTKLEKYDRYLSYKEAEEISGLSSGEFQRLKALSKEISELIRKKTLEVGVENDDGKFEFAILPDRSIMLVDALGTPDECRFSRDGVQLSKELARAYYRGTPWQFELEKAKNDYGDDWKNHVKTEPLPMTKEHCEVLSNIYTSLANAIIGKELFVGSPRLDEVVKKAKKIFSS